MAALSIRQFIEDDGDDFDDEVPFWWTPTGQIIRWAIFGGIVLVVFLFFILAYWHARRRLKKGLAPLAYHRWLLSRELRAQYDPAYRNPEVNYNTYRPEQYGMHPYPPPVYDPNAPAPPTYQPPVGATKVDPSQYSTQPLNRSAAVGDSAPEYSAPPGPPPAALRPDQTGSSSTSNNPYRL